MVDSIGNNRNLSSVPVVSGTSSVLTDESVGAAGLGYSNDNSVSYSESDQEGGAFDSSVDLDIPEGSFIDSREYLQQSFNARLDSFRTGLSEFNARFNSGYVDVSDTQSLLLLIKGVVNDTQILAQANNLGQNATSRLTLQALREGAAQDQIRLGGEILTKQQELSDLAEESGSLIAQQSESTALREVKMARLQSAQSSGDTDQIAAVQAELSLLEALITALEVDSAVISDLRTALEGQQAAKQVSLSLAQDLLDFSTNDIPQIKATLSSIRVNYDPSALETGEEAVQEAKRNNQEVENWLERDGMRLDDNKLNTRERVNEVVEEEQQALVENIGNPLLQGTPLSPAELRTLSLLTPVSINPQTVQAGSEPPTREEVARLTQGLALAIQAEPPQSEEAVTASEEQPVDQAYLGDSRTLEGANNPQAFSLLLLEKNRIELRENITETTGLQSAENLESQKIADLIEEQQQVDAMVTDALEEAEKADAVIRRRPV